MALTVFSKRLPTPEKGMEDRFGARTYEVVFEVDQTDSGSRAAGVAVVIAAQLLGVDPVPLKGDEYSFDGTTDLDSFCQEIEWQRPDPDDRERRWHVACRYASLDGTDHGTIIEPDPLLWPTEYWVEWTEEQVVLQEAANVEELLYADSFPRTAGTLGPVVNACGIEFTEPLMKTIYYPVLHAQKAYASLDEIVALNNAFQGTTNNATWLTAPARTAKYLTTESGRKQRLQGVDFYMGVTRVWFKRATWDRKVLNNGWSHFKRPAANPDTIIYDANGNRVFFKNLIYDDPSTIEADPDADPDVPCSEPLNLTLDGTLVGVGDDTTYITYRDLEEVSYAGIGIGS